VMDLIVIIDIIIIYFSKQHILLTRALSLKLPYSSLVRVSILTRDIDIDIAIMCVCPSVCLSVRHVTVFYRNG